MQTDHLEHFREKLRMAQDEAKSMQAQNELLERFVGWLKTNHSKNFVMMFEFCWQIRFKVYYMLIISIETRLCFKFPQNCS